MAIRNLSWLLLLAAAGCAPTVLKPIEEDKTPAPKGTQVVSGVDYRITLPDHWLVLDLKKMKKDEIEKKLKGTRYEPAFDAVMTQRNAGLVRFFAFVKELEHENLNGNLNLIVAPGAKLYDVLESNRKQVMRMDPKAKELKNFTKKPNSGAFELSMQEGRLKMFMMIEVVKTNQYILTLTVPAKADIEKAREIAR
ncbi:MAG: hypothetical protein JNK63_05090, partial [Chthonomonas sp.]|nr:hypothetical protein [Chthonomonas sp.]